MVHNVNQFIFFNNHQVNPATSFYGNPFQIVIGIAVMAVNE